MGADGELGKPPIDKIEPPTTSSRLQPMTNMPSDEPASTQQVADNDPASLWQISPAIETIRPSGPSSSPDNRRRHDTPASLELHIRGLQTDLDNLISSRAADLRACRSIIAEGVTKAFSQVGLCAPRSHDHGPGINLPLKRTLSEFVRRTKCSLPSLVRLLRGETAVDPRPNKALDLPDSEVGSHSASMASTQSPTEVTNTWETISRHGVVPPLLSHPPQQPAPPANHSNLALYLDDVRALLRKGQDEARFIVLDLDVLDQWPEVFCSPLGVATRDDNPRKVRLIHDLSWPLDQSVNAHTDRDLIPVPSYDGHMAIARRILQLKAEYPGHDVHIGTGDVSGAFRHVPIAADFVHLFAATLPEDDALIIDTSCPFGWTGSPGCYHVAAQQINRMYGSTCPSWRHQPAKADASFHPLVWVDDHVCVEVDLGSRTQEAGLALRRAMASVLGPESLNEDKFRPFGTTCRALGLDWDTSVPSVSLPQHKIEKGLRRIAQAVSEPLITSSDLHKLIGTLRYVSTCVPASRSFYNHLVSAFSPNCGGRAPSLAHDATPGFRPRTSHRRVRKRLTPDHIEGLQWCSLILRSVDLNGVALSRLVSIDQPHVHLFMDASDQGLCALNPATTTYIQYRYSDAETRAIAGADPEWHINVRELSNVFLAVMAWAGDWRPRLSSPSRDIHVRCWIDNSSALSWVNHGRCTSTRGRHMLHVVSYYEATLGFRITAAHIPGGSNTIADAGSRVWGSPAAASLFTNACSTWSQVQPETDWLQPSMLWQKISDGILSAKVLSAPTGPSGANGGPGATGSTSRSGCRDPTADLLASLAASLLFVNPSGSTNGSEATPGERSV